jgi:hypothetical protein
MKSTRSAPAPDAHGPLTVRVLTDPEAHAGTSYKAAGWEPMGQTVGFERHRCDFFASHC